jgi:hypothetical protein
MSIDDILHERAQTHGDFADVARIAQEIKAVYRETRGWPPLDDLQRESIDMIAVKLARILAGNPNFPDHFSDICGYARLVELALHHADPSEVPDDL